MNTEAKAIARSHAAGVHLANAGKTVGGDADAGLFAFLLTGLGDAATLPGIEPVGEGVRARPLEMAADGALQVAAQGLPPEHAQSLLSQMVGASASAAAGANAAVPMPAVAEPSVLPLSPALPGAIDTPTRQPAAGMLAGSDTPWLSVATAPGVAPPQVAQSALAPDFGVPVLSAEPAGPTPHAGGRPHGTAAAALEARAAAEPARGDGLQQMWRAATDVPPARDAALALGTNATALNSLTIRRDRERDQERGTERTHILGGTGELNPSVPLPTVAPVPAAAATVGANIPDIAQQFHYWINADVQKAELQVDGMGGEPVQVQISLNGNEAQVVFRTDQAQTRELLGHAMDTLDQMLRAQGMALGGGWVGASGGRGQSSQGQYAPPAPRSAGVSGVAGVRVSPQGLVTGLPLSVTGRNAQGVDCFV